ncbi:MAG: NAD(+) synthase [Methylobacterium frigidaeris]
MTRPALASPPPSGWLALDGAAAAGRIAAALRDQTLVQLRKRGIVLGLSGGIDSSVTAALAAAAVGPSRVLGVLMPENDSDPDSLRLGRLVAGALGIETVLEEIGPTLDAAGCYRRRDEAIRQVVPGFGPGWGCKLVIDAAIRQRGYTVSVLVVQDPDGRTERHRLPAWVYQAVVAAANMKQRTRKQLEYYHADRLNYAVAGTPNRLEYDQGFFVRNGDGAADVKPIAHLYKTQVYALARRLGVPEEICRRPPTTDTWSLPQTQEEFYFSVDYAAMDLCLYAVDHGHTAEAAAAESGLTVAQVEQVWKDIAAKRKVARILHAGPMTIDPVTIDPVTVEAIG